MTKAAKHEPILAPIALEAHTAVLGKTGSGKTSTSKLIVEFFVENDFRVCILDPIKSDWWGVTSSASGKSAGLPFQILGGPRGHVPLHGGAGAAIGEVVANGELPLSIIDMADFGPKDHARFFVDFASTLFRKMRGTLILVVEEAHIFAPKDRFGDEAMSIFWFKRLASAARSKGIRLLVNTQRLQELHNTVLGSCETVIAHRMTLPADQIEILKWLKSNLTKEQAAEVANSISSLKTGEAWVCSGEAGVFERRQFPRIHTFDNTATPSGKIAELNIATARVDAEQLKALIGKAADEAAANDPKILRGKIAELERKLRVAETAKPAPAPVDEAAITAKVTASVERMFAGRLEEISKHARGLDRIGETLRDCGEDLRLASLAIMGTANRKPTTPAPRPAAGPSPRPAPSPIPSPILAPSPNGSSMSNMRRKFLAVLAQRGRMPKGRLLLFAGYRSSGDTSVEFASLAREGLAEVDRSEISITEAGRAHLGRVDPLPSGQELREQALRGLSKCGAALLRVWFDRYPEGLTKGEVLEAAGYKSSGDTSVEFARLARMTYIVEGDERGQFRAAPEFFS